MLRTETTFAYGPVTINEFWTCKLNEHLKSCQEYNPDVDDFLRKFWRPGFTVWIAEYTEKYRNITEVEKVYAERISDKAYDFTEFEGLDCRLISYRLKENVSDNRKDSFYIICMSPRSQVHFSIYFDDEADLIFAEQIRNSIHYHEEEKFL